MREDWGGFRKSDCMSCPPAYKQSSRAAKKKTALFISVDWLVCVVTKVEKIIRSDKYQKTD
jgi:hypothetical protein